MGTTIKEISTHKAVKENGVINIYETGMDINGIYPEWSTAAGERVFEDEDLTKHPDWFKDTLMETIPLQEEEDLFAIFERLEENNRCNVAEANAALLG